MSLSTVTQHHFNTMKTTLCDMEALALVGSQEFQEQLHGWLATNAKKIVEFSKKSSNTIENTEVWAEKCIKATLKKARKTKSKSQTKAKSQTKTKSKAKIVITTKNAETKPTAEKRTSKNAGRPKKTRTVEELGKIAASDCAKAARKMITAQRKALAQEKARVRVEKAEKRAKRAAKTTKPRIPGSYMIWLKSTRPVIKAQLAEKLGRLPKVSEVCSVAAEFWKALPQATRDSWSEVRQQMVEERDASVVHPLVDYESDDEC
jgi:hypothetical protein